VSRGAPAKINLGLVVGPVRASGKHEVVTLLQRVDLRDEIVVEPREDRDVVVEGYPDDTLVRGALVALADRSGAGAGWHVRLEKRIPVAAGLGGGSSDAAAALALANSQLARPLPREELLSLAADLGADVPFFLTEGTQLGLGDGSELVPVSIPLDFAVLLVLPRDERKLSTADVYRRFDERGGSDGFEARRTQLLAALERVREPRDLAALPRNDLALSPLASELESLGAFRADASGAGPSVYGLFDDARAAERAARSVRGAGTTWLTQPVAT
jgi:4-diphosphocytidyl-2-C-methyl-D-erythritol kinase